MRTTANILGRRAGRIAFGIVLIAGMGSLAWEVIRGNSLWGTFGGPFSAEAGRHTLGAALTKRREVGPAEAINLFWSSLIFLALGALAFFVPKAISIPFMVLTIWWAVAGLFQSWRLYKTAEVAESPEDTGDVTQPGKHRHA